MNYLLCNLMPMVFFKLFICCHKTLNTLKFQECDAFFDDHCFKLYPDQLNWTAAKVLCESNGGRMPEICSAEINDGLKNLLNDTDGMLFNCLTVN